MLFYYNVNIILKLYDSIKYNIIINTFFIIFPNYSITESYI